MVKEDHSQQSLCCTYVYVNLWRKILVIRSPVCSVIRIVKDRQWLEEGSDPSNVCSCCCWQYRLDRFDFAIYHNRSLKFQSVIGVSCDATRFSERVNPLPEPWMRYTFDKPSRSSSTDSVSVRWAYKYRTRNPQIESSLTLQSQISNHSTSMAGRPAHDVFQALAQSSQNRFPSKPTTCLWIFTKVRTTISVGCASSMNVVLLSHCVCSLKQHARRRFSPWNRVSIWELTLRLTETVG